MSRKRYIYSTSLSWGGDEPTAELEVVVAYSVEWGQPESGRFGPPENYDPGSGSLVEDISVLQIDGKHSERYEPETIRAIIDALEQDHHDEMLDWASDDEEGARDAAADLRRRTAGEQL